MESPFAIVLISSDAHTNDLMRAWLAEEQYGLEIVGRQRNALEGIERQRVDLIVADAQVPDLDLLELSAYARDPHPSIPLVVLGQPAHEGSPAVWQIEAWTDYALEKPVDRTKLMEAIEGFATKKAFIAQCGLIGNSEAIQEVIETSLQIAPTEASVLLTGESGTGKELVALAIHRHSPRRFGPFVPLDCGAIAEGILESELFGHEKGSFTGALSRRKGVFEAADGGTIFLDEIGEMNLPVQVRLLRVLEEKEFRRVGGTEPIKVDVRVISASNKDLGQAIHNNEFRRDLYYRLKVVRIHIAPLRERREDIRLLINAFIEDYCKEHGAHFAGISENAVRMLENYGWPGNVRELKNLVESMIVLSPKTQITEADIPAYLGEHIEVERNLPVRLNKTPEQSERELIYRALIEVKRDVEDIKGYLFEQRRVDLPPFRRPSDAEFSEDTEPHPAPSEERIPPRSATLEEMTKEMIEQALRDTHGNRKAAAKMLGTSVRTLYRKLKSYGIS